MTENIPPATAAGGSGPNGVAAVSGPEQMQNRGIPYYEKLRRELRETIQKKRLMDKSMVCTCNFLLFLFFLTHSLIYSNPPLYDTQLQQLQQ